MSTKAEALRIELITLFPEFFKGPLSTGLVGKAIAAGRAELGFIDPRDFTSDRHRTVDDTPYGGGGGMVMKAPPLAQAIVKAKGEDQDCTVLLMSPQGAPVQQTDLMRWAKRPKLVMISGRYEGFDERIRELVDEEVSLGDFVLTGGEYAALTLIDGVIRLLDGTLGNERSAKEDSFSEGLLEHPQYTRPLDFQGRKVPEILTTGDHTKVDVWRHERALLKTVARRPDLLKARAFSAPERRVLIGAPRAVPALSMLVRPKASELPDLFRLAVAYGLDALLVLGDEMRQAAAELSPIEAPWPLTEREEKRRRKKRQAKKVCSVDPAEVIRLVSDTDAEAVAREGGARLVGARAGAPIEGEQTAGPMALRALGLCLVLCEGPWKIDCWLPSVRVRCPANALPLLSAASVLLDRLVGER